MILKILDTTEKQKKKANNISKQKTSQHIPYTGWKLCLTNVTKMNTKISSFTDERLSRNRRMQP